MVQETEAPAAAPAPVAVPTPDVQEATEPTEGVVIPEGEEAPAAAVPDIDPDEWWEEQTTTNPKIKEWDDTRLDELRKKTHSEVQSRLQPILERADRTAKGYADTAQNAYSAAWQMLQIVQKAENSGMLDEGTLANALAQNAPGFVQLLSGLSATAQRYDAAQEFMTALGEVIGDTEFAPKFNARWRHNMTVGASKEEDALLSREAWEAAIEKVEKRADEKGYKRGLKEGSGTATAAAKGEARAKGGPDTAQAGGKPSTDHQQRLDRLAYGRDSDGNVATAEDRAWLAAQE